MFGKLITGKRKGLEASLQNLILVIIVVAVLVGSLYKFAPQMKGIIIKWLKSIQWGEPYTGSCARKCSDIETVGHDMGTITAGVANEPFPVCPYIGELENIGRDYFKFKVSDTSEGEVSVKFNPEYYKKGDPLDVKYYCYAPILSVYSGECGNLHFIGMDSPFPMPGQCRVAEVKFYSEPGETYYVEVEASSNEEEPLTTPFTQSGQIILYLTGCENCIAQGKEWCAHPNKDRQGCFGKCSTGLLGNCGGGICIRDDSDYCTPSVCDGKAEADCIADPWCKPCPQCKNYKINEYGEFKCVGVFDSCDYLLCNHDICEAKCDLLNPCSSTQELCDPETCECDTRYCCNCPDGSYLCTISSLCSSICSFGGGNFGNPCSDKEQCKGGPFP